MEEGSVELINDDDEVFEIPDFEMVCLEFDSVEESMLLKVYLFCNEINWEIGGVKMKDWVSLIKTFLRYEYGD